MQGEVIAATWPEQIEPGGLKQDALIAEIERARLALLQALDLSELA